MVETSLGGARREFPETHWSLIRVAGGGSPERRREALAALVGTYWKPVYFYVRRSGHGVEAAKDLTQEFFARLLERDVVDRLDEARGSFRSFLMTGVRHFLCDAWDRERAQRRGGGVCEPLDAAEADFGREVPSAEIPPDQAFLQKWAAETVRTAFRALREGLERSGRGRTLDVLQAYLAAPRPPTYRELADRLGLGESDVANSLHLARCLLRSAIEDRLRPGVSSQAELEEDLRDVLRWSGGLSVAG